MGHPSEFAYAQARIQSRHGQRLGERDWKTLESARSLPSYLERARSTAMAQFLAEIGPESQPHAVERNIRHGAARYAAEVASFAPNRWRPAIAWLGALARLPVLDGLAAGAAPPSWASDDPALGDRQEAVGARWLRQWRRLWPKGDASSAELSRLVAQSMRAIEAGGASGGTSREPLRRLLTRTFRSHGASPLAMIAHIGLALLDIERLRGGLIRRRLFTVEEEGTAS
jgi:hypothetical protein